MATRIDVQQMLDLKAASYQMAAMNDKQVEEVLQSTAKARMLQESLDSVASTMATAVQMQTYAGFIKDEGKRAIVAQQCDAALEKAIETMAAALA